jgi:hypothetical protein
MTATPKLANTLWALDIHPDSLRHHGDGDRTDVERFFSLFTRPLAWSVTSAVTTISCLAKRGLLCIHT